MQSDVLIAKAKGAYPEFPYDNREHPMYCALGAIFKAWQKDPDNPFEDMVRPGDTVVIKPNWVTHFNHGGYGIEPLITHSSLIKIIIDMAAKALQGKGTIIVGDAPLQSCDFEKLVKVSRIGEIIDLYRKKYPGITFQLEDWRLTIIREDITDRDEISVRADIKDYLLVDAGRDSFLEDLADYWEKLRIAAYKKTLLINHHRPGKHEYLVTNRIRQAKLFVNLPKIKTHMKAGVTGALKNIVGINGHKEYLPHHIKGAYCSGGDSYQRWHPFRYLHDELSDYVWDRYAEMSGLTRKFLCYLLDALRWGSLPVGGESTSVGSWSGNETIWRTVLDINHILYFSEHSPGKVLTIADGIIAGEGQGPLKPIPKPAGILVAGENPAYIDAVIARIAGYNVSRIPAVFNAIYDRRSKFGDTSLSKFNVISILDGDAPRQIAFEDIPNMHFKKPKFWGHAARNI